MLLQELYVDGKTEKEEGGVNVNVVNEERWGIELSGSAELRFRTQIVERKGKQKKITKK